MLYQVATAGLSPDDIAQNIRGVFQLSANVDVRQSRVTGIDCDARRVLVEDGPPLPYDSPIISACAVSSDFGIPGVAEHAIPLKTVANAIAVRTTILERFEEANSNRGRIPVAASRDRRAELLPQLAPVAMQGARHAARSIVHDTPGKKRRRFRYVDRGVMAAIGRRAAVAEIPGGIHFGGTLGWLGLHLVYLIGFPQPGPGARQLDVDVPAVGPRQPRDRARIRVTQPEPDLPGCAPEPGHRWANAASSPNRTARTLTA